MGKSGLLSIDEVHLAMSWSSFGSVLILLNFVSCFCAPDSIFDHMHHLPNSSPNISSMALTATATPAIKEMLHGLVSVLSPEHDDAEVHLTV